MTCKVDGCDRQLRARGYCNSHYIRLRTKGDPCAGSSERGLPRAWIDRHLDYRSDECLIWPFSRNNRGYGRVAIDGFHLAHRLMCFKAHGPSPTRQHEAAHSCGGGHVGCVNPRHLRWATPTENAADKMASGTVNHGSRNGRAVLDEVTVLRVVAMRSDGFSYSDIKDALDIPVPTVASILQGQNWSHLTGIPRKRRVRVAIMDAG